VGDRRIEQDIDPQRCTPFWRCIKRSRARRYSASSRSRAAEWQTPRRWSLDETSPFERVRLLDPEPAQGRSDVDQTRPAFGDGDVAKRQKGGGDAHLRLVEHPWAG